MKKNIYLWALYDFANSILSITFLFYFSQWLVVDSGRPDWWFNVALIVSSLLFILSAPIAARHIDRTGRKLPGLRVTSAVLFILYLMVACVTIFWPIHVVVAVVVYTFALYFYLMSFLYYTPMLNDLSTHENRSHVSGIGGAANYLGQVTGLLATLPFVTGAIYFFGAHGRAQALLPAVILSALFALPTLIMYREEGGHQRPVSEVQRTVVSTMKSVFANRNLLLLLVGYFFFSDALLTFSNNFPIYLQKVHEVGDSIKAYLTLSILFFSGIGAFIFGKLADKKGKKRVLSWLLIAWCVFFPLLAFAPSFSFVVVLCVVAGIMFGPVWAVSRAMVSDYAPREIEASSFGLYVIAERFATFIGPIVWGASALNSYSRSVTGRNVYEHFKFSL
ncbi:MFS transporter, partial [bacterium]|nr:MFS transporter [bacterium]